MPHTKPHLYHIYIYIYMYIYVIYIYIYIYVYIYILAVATRHTRPLSGVKDAVVMRWIFDSWSSMRVLQCVLVCCSVLQCVAVYSVLQCVAVCCSVLQCDNLSTGA